MTIGLGVLCSAVSFFKTESVSSSTTSTSFLESGDQANSDTPPRSCVTRCASPPRRSSSQICAPLPSCRPDKNARYRPSGLQRGALSLSGLDVSRSVVAPSQLVIQISLSDLSFAESIVVTVYATHPPSGDICGSRTSLRWERSPLRMARFAWPLAGEG